MADSKISQLTPITGANLQDGDEFVVARAASEENFAVSRSEMFKDTPDIITTTIQTTNLQANDGTPSVVISDSTGLFTISTELTVNGDINVTGTVDGRDIAADGTKLDGLNAADYVNITSSTGSAEIPVGTEAQRDGSPAAGYFRFNTDISSFEGFNGTTWGSVGGGATGGGGDQVFVENDQTVTEDYTIPADKNAMSTGPVTVNSGVTVTISTGARYVVI